MATSRRFLGALVLALGAASTPAASAGTVELISRISPVPDTFGTSSQPAMSADGRYVAFLSDAPNLVPGQVDGAFSPDVFLHDRVAGTTTLVSHAAGSPNRAARTGGAQALQELAISDDGRYVAFNSPGVDLVAGAVDANLSTDVFLWDRVTGTTTLVSHEAGAAGTAAIGASYGLRISADGSFVAFTSNAGNLVAGQSGPAPGGQTANVFLWSRAANTLTLVSRKAGTAAIGANGSSAVEDLSADGDVLVFTSAANDLIPNVTDTNPDPDVYVYRRSSGALSLVSRASNSPLVAAGATGGSASVSDDGRYVAFASTAGNLVPNQVENTAFSLDAFLFDRTSGEMRLASHTNASPLTAGGISFAQRSPVMSADGRYVAFVSQAADLVPGQLDTAGSDDVFVYDRVAGTTALASHSHIAANRAGSPGDAGGFGTVADWPSLSADGRFLVFESTAVDLTAQQTDVPLTSDVFLYDQTSKSVTLVSRTGASASAPGNGPSEAPVISADGSVAAFTSEATDLGEGQIDPNGFRDLFLYRRASGEITSPSRRDPGLPPLTATGPSTLGSLSADGRFVAFLRPSTEGTSEAVLKDTTTGGITLLSLPAAPPFNQVDNFFPVLSADGRTAALLRLRRDLASGDTLQELYLYDRVAGTFTLANSDGFPVGPPSLSADGRFVVYECYQCALVPGHPSPGPDDPAQFEVFLFDRVAGTNTLVSHSTASPTARADNRSFSPRISADGRFVVFASDATNLVPGQIDVSVSSDLFLFDRTTGAITLVSHAAGAATTAIGLIAPDAGLSADGRFVAFHSPATNLVPGQVDTNDRADLFLLDRVAGTTVLVSHNASSPVTAANGSAFSDGLEAALSADGRFLVYASLATDLVAGLPADADTNQAADVFLYDRVSGTSSLVSHAHGAPLRAGDHGALEPRLSADGSRIAFQSFSTDLITPAQTVPRDAYSLYVQNRSAGTTTLIGPSHELPEGDPGPLDSLATHLSADGRRIAFTSDAPLVSGDYNGTWDVYLWSENGGTPGGPTPLPPCRLLDTRRRADRPILTSNVQRTITARGVCGVPATAKKVLVKVTVFTPSGKGNLRFYPGAVTATPAGILRFERGATRTESFTLPLGTDGKLTILPFVASKGTVHGAVEVNGYSE